MLEIWFFTFHSTISHLFLSCLQSTKISTITNNPFATKNCSLDTWMYEYVYVCATGIITVTVAGAHIKYNAISAGMFIFRSHSLDSICIHTFELYCVLNIIRDRIVICFCFFSLFFCIAANFVICIPVCVCVCVCTSSADITTSFLWNQVSSMYRGSKLNNRGEKNTTKSHMTDFEWVTICGFCHNRMYWWK